MVIINRSIDFKVRLYPFHKLQMLLVSYVSHHALCCDPLLSVKMIKRTLLLFKFSFFSLVSKSLFSQKDGTIFCRGQAFVRSMTEK